MKISINNKEYDVLVPETEEQRAAGLQNVEEMSDNEGMLFIFDEPQTAEF